MVAFHIQRGLDQAVPHPVVLGCFAVPQSLKFQLTVITANGATAHVPTTLRTFPATKNLIPLRRPKDCVAGDGPRKPVGVPAFFVAFNNVGNNIATIIGLALIGMNKLNLITP